jgi:2-dehydro-3-deoxygluconokinase
LWAERPGEAPTVLRQLLSCADLAFVTERDLALALERDFVGPDDLASRAAAAEAAFAAFPRLERIAGLLRMRHPAGHQEIAAAMFTRQGAVVAETLSLAGVVDRIGSGDAFAAGVLHGLLDELIEKAALDCGLRCAALKHGVPGDFPMSTAADLATFEAPWIDVRR